MILADTELEKSLWSKGYSYIVGIDEAGRGPWAGPVSIGGVILKKNGSLTDGVADSKKISEKRRKDLVGKIKEIALAWSVKLISNEDIDNVGIAQAINAGMEAVVSDLEEKIGEKVDYLIIDGANIRKVGEYHQSRINQGDMLHYSIAAASILAKEARDDLMREVDKLFPEYEFAKHVGYGTKIHMEALAKYGPCKLHRRSYKPIAKLIEETPVEIKTNWKYWGR